ncbi:hypothetical protein CCUS01_17165 [Colletotrichum cuscutae]|uniref:Uncharacterized protein n=1 Tax=Colletotrichum cuscutae TaxID=1209917 RepID=A0AAI9V914_9PEZI|nr:hypothetical protein CCUS01_17165 [Colletotrichum cuscutae]
MRLIAGTNGVYLGTFGLWIVRIPS